MIDRFKRLFGALDHKDVPQQQREAMLDLLIWTMYVDAVLAWPENDTLDQMAGQMTWDSVTPVEQYLNRTYARIRGVLGDEEEADVLLEDIRKRLGNRDMRQQAYDASAELARVDGEVAEAERAFLDRVRRSFELA